MGEPIDIGEVRVGDIVRIVNPSGTRTTAVTKIDQDPDGYVFVHADGVVGGRPGTAAPYTRFFLVDRPTRKAARALAELAATKTQIPHAILRREIAPMLGLTKKGGRRRRRKTRKSRT